MKKRDFFAILAAGVAATVVVQAVYRWWYGSECDEGCCDEDGDLDEYLEESALDESYDEGFADGFNGDYQGANPAAQVLQAELDQIQAKCPYLCSEVGSDEPDEPDEKAEETQA